MKYPESHTNFPEALTANVPYILVALQERLATIIGKIDAKTENIFESTLNLLTPYIGEPHKIPKEGVLAKYLEELGQDKVEIQSQKDSGDGRFKIIVKGARELEDHGQNSTTYSFEDGHLLKIEERDNREGSTTMLTTYITYAEKDSNVPIMITKSKDELGKKTMVEWRTGVYENGGDKDQVVIRRDWDDYYITGQKPTYVSAFRASSLQPNSQFRDQLFAFKNPREFIVGSDVLRADVMTHEHRYIVPIEFCTPTRLLAFQ